MRWVGRALLNAAAVTVDKRNKGHNKGETRQVMLETPEIHAIKAR